MVFSSVTFLFFFLPLVLAAYYLVPRGLRNSVLLWASLLFYFWGSQELILLMLGSIVGNYLFGLWIDGTTNPRKKHTVFVLSLCFNLGLLFYYKYFNFFMDSVNAGLVELGRASIPYAEVVLPIGISFFTFQAMSYVIDLYHDRVRVQRSLINFALYKALFPQLIAGPIVRYIDVAEQFAHRVHSSAKFLEGVRRFITGLGKKVIIANGLGEVADRIFALPADSLPPGVAWLGVVAYFFQIYFDFSGYSDMAIGLGRMFGFEFLENFNYPYISKSITEFWRRWHISLSTWFRDYLYIPLGGNRISPLRTYLNLYIVFALCGLWHGASWNFLVWGLFHGTFLVLERALGSVNKIRIPDPLKHAYVILVVLISWVLFRAENLDLALQYLGSMFNLGGAWLQRGEVTIYSYLNPEVILLLVLATLFSAPLTVLLESKVSKIPGAPLRWVRGGAYVLVLMYCSILLSAKNYNPFIYFRF